MTGGVAWVVAIVDGGVGIVGDVGCSGGIVDLLILASVEDGVW